MDFQSNLAKNQDLYNPQANAGTEKHGEESGREEKEEVKQSLSTNEKEESKESGSPFLSRAKRLYFMSNQFIWMYDPDSLLLVGKVEHHIKNFSSSESKCLLTRDNRLFLCGSYRNSRKSAYEFDTLRLEVLPKADMKYERDSHAFIELRFNCLLAIGGRTTGCEAYDVHEDIWITFSPLNEERKDLVACVFEERVVYAYGGTTFGSKGLCYEKIRLTNSFNGVWEIVKLPNLSLSAPKTLSSYLTINDSECLIFGGLDTEFLNTQKCVIFNMKDETTRIAPYNLQIEDNFYGTSMTYKHKDKFYVFSSIGNIIPLHLHVFNGTKWVVIQQFIKVG